MVDLNFLKKVEESHYFVKVPIGCTLDGSDPIPIETDMYGNERPVNLKRLIMVRLPLLRIAEIANDAYRVLLVDKYKAVEIMENTHKYVTYVDRMKPSEDEDDFIGSDLFYNAHEPFFQHRDLIYNLGMSVAKHNKRLYFNEVGERIDPLNKNNINNGVFDSGEII